MLATGKLVDQGEAIGIIAAQSIGEPGTQLTMRTFHTGGVAGEDITHGLPRVVELFEARTPKGAAVLAESSGVVRIGENEKGERTLTVVADDGEEEIHAVSMRTHLAPGIVDGAEVEAGAQLTGDAKSSRDPKKILDIEGIRKTQQYLVDEVQRVYREQGVSIHDKHVEVIVRQMLRRVGVSDPGDSAFLPGQKADAREFANVNKRLVAEGGRPAEGRPELMGITKASLATESWLSAASFQETTRVLTEAAIEGKNDGLEGLKENVIIGKLIPAGTGMPRVPRRRHRGARLRADGVLLVGRGRAGARRAPPRQHGDPRRRRRPVDPRPGVATDPFAPPAGGLVAVPDPAPEPAPTPAEVARANSRELDALVATDPGASAGSVGTRRAPRDELFRDSARAPSLSGFVRPGPVAHAPVCPLGPSRRNHAGPADPNCQECCAHDRPAGPQGPGNASPTSRRRPR